MFGKVLNSLLTNERKLEKNSLEKNWPWNLKSRINPQYRWFARPHFNSNNMVSIIVTKPKP